MIVNGTAESTATESFGAARDLLSTIYTSPNFNAAIRDRFASWRIRGYSITRMVMGTDYDVG